VTANSLFHLASISKTFVATAVMQVVERAKLELHALRSEDKQEMILM